MGLCVGMYFMYLSPTIADIGIKRDKLTEYQDVLEKTKELKDLRDSLSTKYNNIPQDKLDMLGKIIPEKFDSVHFSNDLNSISSKYGMAIKAIKMSDQDKGAPQGEEQATQKSYKTIKASFSLSGHYDQFLLFLKDLEASLRIIDVTGLTMKSSPSLKKGEEVSMDYTVDVQIYSLK